jgi:hypothetical protein
MRGSSGSSIIIEGSLLAGGGTGPGGGKLYQADVVLQEVPAQLVIRDNFVQTAADDGRWGSKADYRLVKVVPEVDLDGPYMAFATDVSDVHHLFRSCKFGPNLISGSAKLIAARMGGQEAPSATDCHRLPPAHTLSYFRSIHLSLALTD